MERLYGKNNEEHIEFIRSDTETVGTLEELTRKIAILSYRHKDYVLYYRGQNKEYRHGSNSLTFYPNIYRNPSNDPRLMLKFKFNIMNLYAEKLYEVAKEESLAGWEDLKKRDYIKWSILQHYKVCDTHLMDFTHSIQVACSFAKMDNENEFGYIFIYGLPYLTNRITINSEQDLAIVRLLSICPPNAMRPYFQEGFVAGTTDITYDYEDKSELDFNVRLIGKYKFSVKSESFWGTYHKAFGEDMLYPKDDDFLQVIEKVKDEQDSIEREAALIEFTNYWRALTNRMEAVGKNIRSKADWDYIKEIETKGKQFTDYYLKKIDMIFNIGIKIADHSSRHSADHILAQSLRLEDLLKKLDGNIK